MRRKATPQQPYKKRELEACYSPPPPHWHYRDMSVNSPTIGLLGTYPYYMLTALFFSAILFRRWQLKKGRDNPSGLPLPPGPKGYPLIGNIFDMPVDKPWDVYDEWRKTYGKTSILINSLSPQITGISQVI